MQFLEGVCGGSHFPGFPELGSAASGPDRDEHDLDEIAGRLDMEALENLRRTMADAARKLEMNIARIDRVVRARQRGPAAAAGAGAAGTYSQRASSGGGAAAARLKADEPCPSEPTRGGKVHFDPEDFSTPALSALEQVQIKEDSNLLDALKKVEVRARGAPRRRVRRAGARHRRALGS